MVVASDQPPEEKLPEYSWIAKLGEVRKAKKEEMPKIFTKTYTLEGPKTAEWLKKILGNRKIIAINEHEEREDIKLDELLEGINEPNVILRCYEGELGKVNYNSEVFYVSHGKVGTRGGYIVKDLAPNTLYLVLRNIDSQGSYRLVTVRGEVPLEDILGLTRKYKLEKDSIVVDCQPSCKESDKLRLIGFVYVDEDNEGITICGPASYRNIKLAPLQISSEERQTKG